jgi:hypothetical protein
VRFRLAKATRRRTFLLLPGILWTELAGACQESLTGAPPQWKETHNFTNRAPRDYPGVRFLSDFYDAASPISGAW